ncbi:hypothetical protein QTP86_029095 [Hemibagrus guttatus]|nr:hypothetical protein QTP86_029095 [Hemibagrus guttatus]
MTAARAGCFKLDVNLPCSRSREHLPIHPAIHPFIYPSLHDLLTYPRTTYFSVFHPSIHPARRVKGN